MQQAAMMASFPDTRNSVVAHPPLPVADYRVFSACSPDALDAGLEHFVSETYYENPQLISLI
jgi:hypothetical protein